MSPRRPLSRAPLIAASMLAWLAGCGTAVGTAGTARDTLDGVALGVEAHGCSLVPQVGTAVAVAHDGRVLVVTSAHTVAGATQVTVTAQGTPAPARVVGFDPDLDLAVLSVAGQRTGHSLADPARGQPISVVTWDADTGAAMYDTEIERLLRVTIEDIYVDREVERRGFDFDGEIVPGDSGAPVLNHDGDVVGVVFARSRERSAGFATSSVEIRDLIERTDNDPADVGRCL